MTVFRWLLVLTFSFVADFVNPALPGALEVFADTEEVVHLAGHHRAARLPAAPGRPAVRRGDAASVGRAAVSRGLQARARLAHHGEVRKIPPPGLADGPSAPDDH